MVSKSMVFCFVLVFIVCVQQSYALQKGGTGVCIVSQRHKRPFTVIGYCRATRKWGCRVVKHKFSYINSTICCGGWIHNNVLDTCQPNCSTGCLNGTCIAPDTCRCDPPLILHPVFKNICQEPICDRCVNSVCVANTTCECVENTRRFNETHCAYCGNNYTINPDLTCSPICETPCVNGDCTEPGTCTCFDGYVRKDAFNCERCNCVNSNCVSPNNCVCHPGYTPVNETHCEPKCDGGCEEGICVSPNECLCRNGYRSVEYGCEPICSKPCVNGACTGPEQCSCFEDHLRNVTIPDDLLDVCCRPECGGMCDRNGECPSIGCVPRKVVRIPHCTRKPCMTVINTTKTACCPHYKHNIVEDTCEPVCNKGCINGTCIKPETCFCELPLQLQNNTCLPPVCEPACHNADCINTDTCLCFDGYKQINNTHCGPLCPDNMCGDNMFCSAPYTCTCLPGYKEDNEKDVCIPHCDSSCKNGRCYKPNQCTCNTGYLPDPDDKFNCLPKCQPGCVNATCVSPDTCSCQSGYEPENKWTCKPKCDECENGDCIAPNNCACHDGYSKKSGHCSPDCDHPCQNGICSDPNKCTCNPGFKINEHDNFTCDPICKNECINARCVSPDRCSCEIGYEPENDWQCKPICEVCNNGTCSGPNNCTCNAGYEKEHGQCKPFCNKPCSNGDCVNPNECRCRQGYQLNPDDKFSCDPICNTTENSKCIGPDTCLCLDDYEPTDNPCICKPMCDSCEHGVCPDHCSCKDGYSKKQGSKKCSPVCNPECDNAVCSSPNKCTCFAGYTRVEGHENICEKTCDSPCENGFCENGQCICNPNFVIANDSKCVPIELKECDVCGANCTEPGCFCPDGSPCILHPKSEERNPPPSLAGLQWSWILGGAVGFLLIVLLLVVIHRSWKTRERHLNKTPVNNGTTYDSVVYQTVLPDTLIRKIPEDGVDESEEAYYAEVTKDQNETRNSLLGATVDIEDERL